MKKELEMYIEKNTKFGDNIKEIKTYDTIIKNKRKKLIDARQKRLDEARRVYYDQQ